MKIAVDMRWVRSESLDGIARVSLSLAAEWLRMSQNTWALIFKNQTMADFCLDWIREYSPTPLKADFEVRLIGLSPQNPKNIYALSKSLKDSKAEVFYSPYLLFHPLPIRLPKMVTLHDLIPLKYPDTFKKASRLFRLALTHPHILKQILSFADGWVTVSQNSKKDMLNLLSLPEKKIHVVYWGGDSEHQTETNNSLPFGFGQGREYILNIGRPDPYKNLEGLIRLYHQLTPEQQSKYALVIVGPEHPEYSSHIKALAKDAPIYFTGPVSAADLNLWYQHAALYIHLSFYEGFGLPVLEAMQRGVPVMASNRASLPEVLGSAGVLVDPDSPHELLSALSHLLDSKKERAKLARQGQERALSFSWKKSAHDILGHLKQIRL